MRDNDYKYDTLSTREECNRAIRHLELVMEVVEDFNNAYNLADRIHDYISAGEIEKSQIRPLIHSILIDKYGYSSSSHNLIRNIAKFIPLVKDFAQMKAVDIVLVYYHPELGVIPVNPKNEKHWEAAKWLKRNELMTIFVGEFGETSPKPLYDEAIFVIVELLKGHTIDIPVSLRKGKYSAKKSKISPPKKTALKKDQEQPAAVKKKKQKKEEEIQIEEGNAEFKMTPMYGITVTNGVFHNGNVEAWKKIIRSYESVYKGSQVVIYYDGERINDIDSLFKWGKVKRGTAIMMAVVGSDIKDVAKLRRYLAEGASPRFKQFISGPPTAMLKIFGDESKK
ncbi:MAG: hypothetical protein JW881_21890 [Spirochaetales bacterium]|nr:hypothetical protein [Spirochaetales bacterium]